MWRTVSESRRCHQCGSTRWCRYDVATGERWCTTLGHFELESRMTRPLDGWAEREGAARGDAGVVAAYHGVSPESIAATGGFVEGDTVVLPLWREFDVCGCCEVSIDGCMRIVGDGVSETSRPRRTGVMVATMGVEALTLSSLGFAVVGISSAIGDAADLILSLNLRRARDVVLWCCHGDIARTLLRIAPPTVERVTSCLPPSEFANVNEWAKAGATRQDVLDRVAAIREAWQSRSGRLPV